MRPSDLTAREVASRVRGGGLDPEEYVRAVLKNVERRDGKIHAYLYLAAEEALSASRRIRKKARRGEKLGRLAGVVLGVKDNICVKGMPATCGSRILSGFVPPYSATVIEKLEAEDAIVLGKTNMDEFGMGNTTESSAEGPTRNPWDATRVPGGSSGGSAAAVAAGLATIALGSDTGGSIRCPASYCNVVGLKPTYGSVSRYGLIAYANSLEQISPASRDVSDCSLVFDVIKGRDARDSTSVAGPASVHWTGTVRRMKIGVVKEFLGEGTQAEVKEKVLDARSEFEELGASVKEVSIPSLRYALAAYYVIAMAEASSNLSRYDGVRYGASVEKRPVDWNESYSRTRSDCFGNEVKRRVLLGTFVLSAGYFEAYYLKAQKVRALVRDDLARAFRSFDLLMGPTMPILPPKVGERVTPLEAYLMDVDTVPANLSGIPAISIPCGSSRGLPVGLQLLAPHFGEERLLSAAAAYESAARVGLPAGGEGT